MFRVFWLTPLIYIITHITPGTTQCHHIYRCTVKGHLDSPSYWSGYADSTHLCDYKRYTQYTCVTSLWWETPGWWKSRSTSHSSTHYLATGCKRSNKTNSLLISWSGSITSGRSYIWSSVRTSRNFLHFQSCQVKVHACYKYINKWVYLYRYYKGKNYNFLNFCMNAPQQYFKKQLSYTFCLVLWKPHANLCKSSEIVKNWFSLPIGSYRILEVTYIGHSWQKLHKAGIAVK